MPPTWTSSMTSGYRARDCSAEVALATMGWVAIVMDAATAGLSSWRSPTASVRGLDVSQDEPDLAECRTCRQSLLIDPQQQGRFGTHERQAHEGAHLLRSERSEIQPRRGLATDDVREELEPAVQH